MPTPRLRAVPVWLALALPAAAGGDAVDFARDVRPILAEHCFACHGPDEALRDLGGYRAIVPGDPEESELLLRVTDEIDPMPPPEVEKRPGEAELDTLRRWIEEGAVWEEHWAYVPPRRPARPEVADAEWARDELDLFLLARLEEEGLAPSPEADRAALLRRATFDLTGLPPSVGELDEVVEPAPL